MDKERLKACVIGLGVMGTAHCRVYSELDNIELTSICDRDLKRTNNILKIYGTNKHFSDDYRKLDLSMFDVVSVCTPTTLHYEVAKYFLNNNKHVLVEKPLSMNEDEVYELGTLARDKNVKLMVGHIERFNPAVMKLFSIIDRVGNIKYIETERSSPTPIRIKDVDAVDDLSVHDLDIVNQLMKDYLRGIEYASIEDNKGKHVLGTFLLFYGDKHAVVKVNWITPTIERKLKVLGDKGMFIVDYLTQDLMFYENISYIPDFIDYSVRIMQVTSGDMSKIRVNKSEPLKEEISHFIKCIEEDKQPLVTYEDAYKVLEILKKVKR